jgi:O-acetyl-ADP-ribose deacetylase (regulator of RNase III)
MCGGVFKKGWTDEEASAEQEANGWGALAPEDTAVVCDDCYRQMTALHPPENMMNLIFVDLQSDVVSAWEEHFAGCPQVSVQSGSIFDVECDALVSPANSFGYMDGGLDMHISQFFGWHVQERLQELIHDTHHGELLVGAAEVVPTDHPRIPFVISAPTMRVPMILSDTVNVYLATRAVILLVLHGRFPDGRAVSEDVHTVAVPGMGTGVGRVPPATCARQMRAAVDDVLLKTTGFPSSWHEAQTRHQLLYNDSTRDLQY